MPFDNKILVGNKEWCAFPTLGIPAIKARIDSGAKTSSIHAFNILPFKQNGQDWVSFEIHPLQRERKPTIKCESRVFDTRDVKSSNGVHENRYVIKAPIRFAGESWEIEITLTNRDAMGYRMLLGREAMRGRIVIDPDESFCQGKLSREELQNLFI